MTKSIVVVPDIQMPYEDSQATRAVIKFIGEYQPDEVVQIGDLVDYPHPSRWNKGERGEYEGSIVDDSEYTKRKFCEPLRKVYDGPVGIIEGNHDLRPRAYLEKYAPALTDLSEYATFESLLDFDGFGFSRLPDFYEFVPGWDLAHGHLGGPRVVQETGRTALKFVQRFHKSVIIGHTHRLGMIQTTHGRDGEEETLVGVEVGHLMDMKKAQYLGRSTANWQKGFTILHVDGKHVQPSTVRIDQKRFIVDGQVYRV